MTASLRFLASLTSCAFHMSLYSIPPPTAVLGVAVRLAAACLRFASLMSARARDRSLLSLAILAAVGSEEPAVVGIGRLVVRSYSGLALVCETDKADCTTINGSFRILFASSLRLRIGFVVISSVWKAHVRCRRHSLAALPFPLRILVFALFFMSLQLCVRVPRLGLPFRSIEIHRGRIVILNLIRCWFRLV